MSLALEDLNGICLCPLHTPAFNAFTLRWCIHEYEMEGPTFRYVCCPRPATEPYSIAPPIPHPFVFELIGRITEDDCYITIEGHHEQAKGPLVSCWIEPCPDHISRIEWGAAAQTIHHILHTIPSRHPWRDDVFIGEGDPLAIQLFYEPPEGEVRMIAKLITRT